MEKHARRDVPEADKRVIEGGAFRGKTVAEANAALRTKKEAEIKAKAAEPEKVIGPIEIDPPIENAAGRVTTRPYNLNPDWDETLDTSYKEKLALLYADIRKFEAVTWEARV